MENTLIRSNCLIEAVRAKIKHPRGKIGFDFDSPSKSISFYFDIDNDRWRFRRKLRRHSNKSKIIFLGYRVVENNLI
jgi:hypothetical protein